MSDLTVEVVLTATSPLALTLAAPLPVTLAAGIQGPPGPPGPAGDAGPAGAAVLDGYPIALANPAPGDHLELGATSWTNVPRAMITDGGNF